MDKPIHLKTHIVASDPSRLVNIYNPINNQVVTLHPKTDNYTGTRVLFTGYNGIPGLKQDLCATFVKLDSNGNLVMTLSSAFQLNLEVMGAVHSLLERNKRSILEKDGYEVGSGWDYTINITPEYFMQLVQSYGCIPISDNNVEN